VQNGSQNLEIGIVTQARFIRDTLVLLDAPAPPAPAAVSPAQVTFATDTAARAP
jgi:hypothetical protein